MFRSLIVALSVTFLAIANPVGIRQDTNTNQDIMDIVDQLSMSMHVTIPNIITLQASGEANNDNLGDEFDDLVTMFSTAAENLSNTPVSSGSETESPTNDEIGVNYSNVLQQTTAGLSGLTTDHASNLANMFSELDPAVASSIIALNTTLPGSVNLVHIMMLDARQFLEDEGMTQTLAALGPF